jgi:hypothetical protein
MRSPFHAQTPSRPAETVPFRVRSANDPSKPRTLDERQRPQTKKVASDTVIASDIARVRPIMPATPLVLLLLAAAPPAWSAVPDLPPEIEAAHLAAEAASRAGDYRGAARRLQEILADLERRPATQTPEEEWTRTLLQLALAESTLGNFPAARNAMERVLALDTAAQVDPELFSPAFRREFERARERVSALTRFRLLFTTRDGSGRGFVQGRPSGDVPVEVRLPAGSYRVGVEADGAVRTVTVQLTRDESLVIDTAAVAPDLSARPPRTPLPAAARTSGGWIRPVAWVTTGLAVVAAGIATWQGVAAAGSYSEARGMLLPDGSLKPGVDPAAYAAAANAYASERTTAWIAAGSAVALGAGATVLWLVAPSTRVEAAPGGVAIRF